MKRTVKSKIAAGVLILTMVALGTVIGGDVIVKEGDLSAVTGTFESLNTVNTARILNIPNANFESGDTGWAKDPGWSIVQQNGNWLARIQGTGNNGATIQPDPSLNVVPMKIYKVTVDIGGGLTDGIKISIGGAPEQVYYATGSFVYYFVAVDGSNLRFIYGTTIGYEKTIDNVTVTEYGYASVGKLQAITFEGLGCTASGASAVALGKNTVASGDYSFAVGCCNINGCTTASGYASTAMGAGTKAINDYSIAMGTSTKASGFCSTAIGNGTTASGVYSTAMGFITTASNHYCTAMGGFSTASGLYSTAMGCNVTAGPADYTTAVGKYSTNNVSNSFAIGYGGWSNPKVDFRVESGVVTVGNVAALSGNLYVGNKVDAHTYAYHSSFYDKDTYGRALGYIEDCSKTITINAKGEKEYNHEANPEFLKTWVTVKDYDKYTDKKVWNEELQEYEPERIYQTHQELRTDLGMQVAWLRQCAYELKQENEMLKAELAKIKAKLGME